MKKRITIWVLVLFVVIIAGAIYWRTSTKPSRQVISGTLVKMEIPILSKKADTILIGTVKSKLSSAKDNSEKRLSKVYTDVIVVPEKYLKNPQGSSEIKVRLAGGRTEDEWVWVEGEASLEPEEHVLLFLSKDTEAKDVWTVTGLMQGKFSISGGKAKQQFDKNELELDQLVQQIQENLD